MRQIIDSLIPYTWKILIGAWVLNLITTWYYGWTMTPSCRNEEIWDVTCSFMFMLAVVLFIISWNDIKEEKSNSESISGERDPMFNEAARVIVSHQQGSASLLQRKLKLGYNRAGRIIDQLEAAGIVGPFEGSKARQVLIKSEMELDELLNKLNKNE